MQKLFYLFKCFVLLSIIKSRTINHLSFILLSLFIFAASCDTTEPPIIPPPPPIVRDTITIAVESFTHRSVTLNITSTTNSKNSSVRLIRELNGITTTVSEYPIQTKDTTIIDDNNGTGLLLDTTYTYFAVRVDSVGQLKDTSNLVTQKTLAPTSHNYTWREFTIGEWQSVLYDVWGTDENDVWAVGALTIGGNFYGALHWNGVEWTPDSTVGGTAIYGFTSNDIWVVGGGVFHLENSKWIQKDKRIVNGSVVVLDSVLFRNSPYTSIWGTSSSNLYLGNQWGKIIHWDGSKARVMNLTADYAILDIWGFSEYEIYAVSGFILNSYGRLFKYNGSEWSTIRTGSYSNINYDTYGPFSSVWGSDISELYLVAYSIERRIIDNWLIDNSYNTEIKDRVRGSASNNVFVCGAYGFTAHFNGVDWRKYPLSQQATLLGLQVFNNQVFIVGYDQNTAFIYRGLKQ